jgi:HAMP domain-containing protein
MFKNLNLRVRFSLIILILLVLSLPIITTATYYVLKNNAIEQILTQANMLSSIMEATRAYGVKFTTPIFERELPGKFIVEGMADSFVNYEIQARMSKKHKNYSYKEAAINPLNKRNQADEFETGIIKAFQTKEIEQEWRGFIEKPAGAFYAVLKPIKVRDRSCLSCHGDPDLAPEEVTAQYGKDTGYGWKVGEIIAVDAIYVPSAVPIQQAKEATIIFAGMYFIFFLVLLLIINLLITINIIKPVERLVKVADEISKGDLEKEFQVKNNDEIKILANAFTRMKVSVAKAMQIIQRMNR